MAIFGGICCTPNALRMSDMTMEIFKKQVLTTTSVGTRAIKASATASEIGSKLLMVLGRRHVQRGDAYA